MVQRDIITMKQRELKQLHASRKVIEGTLRQRETGEYSTTRGAKDPIIDSLMNSSQWLYGCVMKNIRVLGLRSLGRSCLNRRGDDKQGDCPGVAGRGRAMAETAQQYNASAVTAAYELLWRDVAVGRLSSRLL